jgi:allantoinase
VWGGIAGAQTLLALLYDEGVVGRALAPEALADLLAAAPARRFGLAPAKGALEVGPTPTWPSSTRRRPGPWRARSCSTATGSAPSWAGRCAAAWSGRSCAGARSRVDGRVVGAPGGRVVRRGA